MAALGTMRGRLGMLHTWTRLTLYQLGGAKAGGSSRTPSSRRLQGWPLQRETSELQLSLRRQRRRPLRWLWL